MSAAFGDYIDLNTTFNNTLPVDTPEICILQLRCAIPLLNRAPQTRGYEGDTATYYHAISFCPFCGEKITLERSGDVEMFFKHTVEVTNVVTQWVKAVRDLAAELLTAAVRDLAAKSLTAATPVEPCR